MAERVGVVTLPEPSLPALFSNVASFQEQVKAHHSGDVRLVFFMNVRHYNRVKRLATQETKYLNLLIFAERLRQFGRLELVDYFDLYRGDAVNLKRRNTEIAASLDPEGELHDLCDRGYKHWYDYARSPAQERLREAIGCDMDSFAESQREDYRMWDKAKYRGDPGTTNDYVEKLLDKVVAAMFVRAELDRRREMDVVGIVGGAEYRVAADLVADRHWSDDRSLQADACETYFASGTSNQIMTGVADRASELARELAGTDGDSFVLGPSIGFVDLFDPERLRDEYDRLDDEEIRADVREALAAFGSTDVDGEGSNARYYADYLLQSLLDSRPSVVDSVAGPVAEVFDGMVAQLPTATLRQVLLQRMSSLRLSNTIRELKSSDLSDAGVFTAAMIVTDPTYNAQRYNRFHTERVDGWCRWSRRLFGSPTDDDEAWRDTQYRMSTWTERPSWFELPDWYTESYV
ncbi:MAG: hypothetical protein ABEJ82_01005 [Haloplanus sp.]